MKHTETCVAFPDDVAAPGLRHWRPLAKSARSRLDEAFAGLAGQTRGLVGYPCSQGFDYRELYRFLGMTVNNIGDPFSTSNYRLNTHEFEREVVDWFTRRMQGRPEDIWGYITNGGTEGNMYGLYLARELYPDGIVYFSEDTHYSVSKILHVLGVRNIMIRSREDGSIDLADLRETLRLHRDAPPIVFANIGTTMKGAIDDVAAIRQMMKDLAISRYYLHSDCALSGMILPFVDHPPAYDFAAGVDSISISGHKLIGSPLPCGVVMARQRNVSRIGRTVEYVGALDTTINGSRNAITPLILWYAIQRLGAEGLRGIVQESLELADYAIVRLDGIGVAAWRNPHSITVVFPRPADSVMEKWQIAPYGSIAHIITLPHVTREVIDALVADMQAAGPNEHGGAFA